jgi:RNA ligase
VDALGNWPQRAGKEGVVVRSGSKMVKLKQADYVELHRIVTNLSPKTIWQMLGNGRTIDSICAEIPDEFHQYVSDIGRNLLDQASQIKYDAEIDYRRCVTAAGGSQSVDTNRKEFARFATQAKHKALLFMLLDGKDIVPVVWDSIKPRGDIKSLVKDEG